LVRDLVATIADRADTAWLALTPARRAAALGILWAAATVPVLSRLAIGQPAADLTVFLSGIDAFHDGRVYRDVVFEYPPYALLWFLLPRALSDDLAGFRLTFGLEIWVIDAAIKAVLLRGVRAGTGLRGLAPFVAYSLGSGALGHVLLQRYDLIPAALTLAGTLTVATGPVFLGGLLVSIGAGTKVYPALFVPALALFAWHRGSASLARFGAGAALGAMPLLAAAFWIPWWRFASYHMDRGLQAESLLASVVWALHLAGVPARWEYVWRAYEVTGVVAASLVGPGRLLWGALTLACVASATLTAWRLRSRAQARGGVDVAVTAAVLLLPITAFVATNTVFSPQFHLWLLPLAALVLSAPPRGAGVADRAAALPAPAVRAALCIFAATFIVPVFYPHHEYGTGLGLPRTAVLLLRNGLMLYATACLWVAVGRIGRARADGPTGE
jgi:hypothetical protein